MIHISDLAKKIEKFLLDQNEEKFKIFLRINFAIDVYICTDNLNAHNYQKLFLSTLKEQEDNNVDDYYCTHYNNLKVKFNIINSSDAIDDPYYENIFSSSNEHINLGPRYRFESLLQRASSIESENDKEAKQIPIVTFYSYKGGMGRTTTMIAYAMSLAANSDKSKRKRVVIIDCDLEAPGYLNFFDLSEHVGLRSGKKNGLVEFISDAQLTSRPEKLDINDYIINVGLDNKNNFSFNNLDNIWIVPAGNLNEGYSDAESSSDRNDYLEGLAKINLSSVQSIVKYFRLLFDKIKETIEPDIILIDSRTGFNDIFGTAAFYLSSSVVGFFGFSRQTQPGLINLLKEYYLSGNNFKLKLVFSILPQMSDKEQEDDWITTHKGKVEEYIRYIDTEKKDFPSFLYLHRNPLLEKIGTGDEQSDSMFVKLVQSREFEDYNILFDEINNLYFSTPSNHQYSCTTPDIQLKNAILKHLKEALSNVSNFAEDTEIREKQFFYRNCMKELFDPKKYLIRGYKGTGKTYLYKALGDKEIASNIQKWAGRDNGNMFDPIFVNILPANDISLVFDSIQYSRIEEPEYYFNLFWQIYTWNTLLMRPEFEKIKYESDLSEYIQPLTGAVHAESALLRINELIDNGLKTLTSIKKDIARINAQLSNQNKILFVLYDRLDTCINPLRWNKAVSPLINYWRNNCESYTNIAPKVFVRTDLFKQIQGTNTARLANSIINIEWTIGEVFGFFFKLIFSNKQASDAYWAIAEKIGIDKDYIQNTKKSFEKFPENQFKSLRAAEMAPIIKVFFGKSVKVGPASLGNPWEYFSKELANADNTAISLRPFINTLDKNAVDRALARTNINVQNGIIPSDIYASKSVRDDTTNKYFDDLTQDAFSKDLLKFKEVIRTTIGKDFRYKSLTEAQFENLISITFEHIVDSDVVKTPGDLKELIFANGIMAEKITTRGRYYTFAPIYWYSWGLENSTLEKEEKYRQKNKKNQKSKQQLVEGETYEGIICEEWYKLYISWNDCRRLQIRPIQRSNNFRINDIVLFTAGREDNKKTGGDFWYATDVRLKDEE